MSEETAKKKRRIRPAPQTVRERAQQPHKTRKKRVKGLLGVIVRIFSAMWRFLKRILRPFRFLLWPFKTKPLRFIGRILSKVFLINYFRESWKELRLVTWPNRKQTWQLTFAVFIFAIVFGIAVAIVDYGLDKVFRKVLLQ